LTRRLVAGGALAAAALFVAVFAGGPGGPRAAQAQEVVVFVDGQPITALDIAHRSKFIEMSTHKQPPRQDVINELIDEMLELREAKRYTVDPTPDDVNNAYANVASNMGIDPSKLTQILVAGGASEDTLKSRLKAQIAWNTLVRGRYKSSLEVNDSDIEAELQLHKAGDQSDVGYQYSLRPIVLIVPHNSPDAVYEGRKREADALRGRFSDCATGIPFAKELREVAVRDPVQRSSADLAPALREILDRTEVGHLTPPEQTAEGIQLFAICSKQSSKSDSPAARQLRDQMFSQRFGAKARRYIAQLRKQAMIEYK
jgi:peptidyl-prolyl cis-trans isomerase SurA